MLLQMRYPRTENVSEFTILHLCSWVVNVAC